MCWAPVRWSKYTTHVYLFLSYLRGCVYLNLIEVCYFLNHLCGTNSKMYTRETYFGYTQGWIHSKKNQSFAFFNLLPIYRQSFIFWLLTKSKSLVIQCKDVHFTILKQPVAILVTVSLILIMDETDLLALHLSGSTYCHKTVIRPPSCQAPRQPTI